MTSSEFIKSQLTALVNKIQIIQCRYEYNEFEGLHTVEILPQNAYSANTDYIQQEQEITLSFIEMFPFENISFISVDSLIKLSNPQFVICGNSFKLVTRVEDQYSLDNLSSWEVMPTSKSRCWPNFISFDRQVEPQERTGNFSFAAAA